MAANDIPEPVRRLIHEHLPSVERLEILLLLFEQKQRAWSVEKIEETIRSTRDSVRQHVNALEAAGLVGAEGAQKQNLRYRYLARTPELDGAVAELEMAYRTRRVAVIELIYAERHENVRTFSEAFKLGKKGDR